MALTPLPTISSISLIEDGSTTNIADSTVYGSPNAARADVGVALLAFKVDADLVETELEIEEYDYNTDSTYVVTNTLDGNQKFVLIIADDYVGATTYNQYDVVFYPTTSLFYQATEPGTVSGVIPTDTNEWAPIDPADIYANVDTATEAGNIVIGIIQTVLTFAAEQCLGDLATEVAKESCCDDCTPSKTREKFENLWTLVYVSQIANTRQKYIEGENFMREAETYCNCC